MCSGTNIIDPKLLNGGASQIQLTKMSIPDGTPLPFAAPTAFNVVPLGFPLRNNGIIVYK